MAEKEKPWYKKFKVMTALISTIIEIVILVVGTKVAPEMMEQITTLMITVGALAMTIIGGHSLTDSKRALKPK